MESACGSLFWDLFKNALWKPLFSGFPNGGSRKQCHVRQWIKTAKRESGNKPNFLLGNSATLDSGLRLLPRGVYGTSPGTRKQCHVRQWIKTPIHHLHLHQDTCPSETVPR